MLKRALNRWDILILVINCIIGSGIFGLPSRIYSRIGIYSIPAFLACAALMLVIILNFSEVGSRFRKTGGPYLYLKEAYGDFVGFLAGWILIISRVASFAALVNLMVDYLGYFSPVFSQHMYRPLTLILITLLFFWANAVGVRNSANLNNLLGVLKILPLLFFVGIGLFFIDPQLLTLPEETPEPEVFNSVLMILVFAFTGFEGGVINTGEMKNPQKDIPFALITATITVSVFYMLIQFVSIGAYPGLASSERPLSDAAHYMLGGWAGILITIGALISIGGTLNANVLSGSRLPFALSENEQFPEFFSRTTRRSKIPMWSLVIYTIVTLLVSLSGTFIYALAINVISKLLIFALISAAVIRFRKKDQSPEAIFQIRYPKLSALLGIVLCIILLIGAERSNLIHVAIAIASGILFYLLYRRFRKPKSKSPVKVESTAEDQVEV
ncbi:amino acid permease [Robertkochia marina]|uniref:Amino acid permease n=1 Tax=Robertkochia marina TaxID=1227945 RepID=A0A4S3LY22_9FLAO|nr:APC family permease [Robertkochia marina]THD66452.1 amino acid permease [Robertkochia marina]TRZ44129.1 amino acid permease [Robertkochia marina]